MLVHQRVSIHFPMVFLPMWYLHVLHAPGPRREDLLKPKSDAATVDSLEVGSRGLWEIASGDVRHSLT
jgi:hypothetical protein